jgi:hypothetical protein
VEQFVGRMNDKSGRGNHATSTGTKRPKLAARYNLLQYTEDQTNAFWLKTGITSSSLSGYLTTLTEATANSTHNINTSSVTSAPLNTPFTASGIFKAGTRRYLQFQWDNGAQGVGVVIDTQLWTIAALTGSGTITASSIIALGGGEYEIKVTGFVTSGGTNVTLAVYGLASSAQNNVTYVGTGATIICGKLDLRPASQATGLIGSTYQRVVDAATYDTAGFLPYLQFDGIDDSMSTGSIDFTATDKMTVWAGVRKLSDAVDGMLCELSINVSGAAGSFYFTAPESSALISYAFLSRGTAAAASAQRASAILSAYPAPITNVLAATGDIAGDLSTIRVNQVAGTSGTGDQGAGNYGNYPLFIGARAGTSVFFNGWLTSLIVRGAQSTQSQIEATESWVNGKTGAF